MTTTSQIQYPDKLIAKGFTFSEASISFFVTEYKNFNPEWVNMNGIYTKINNSPLYLISMAFGAAAGRSAANCWGYL